MEQAKVGVSASAVTARVALAGAGGDADLPEVEAGQMVASTISSYNDCLPTSCQFCIPTDFSYTPLCRQCPKNHVTCETDSDCPSGFFVDDGICKKCKLGCAECDDWETCTSCLASYPLLSL